MKSYVALLNYCMNACWVQFWEVWESLFFLLFIAGVLTPSRAQEVTWSVKGSMLVLRLLSGCFFPRRPHATTLWAHSLRHGLCVFNALKALPAPDHLHMWRRIYIKILERWAQHSTVTRTLGVQRGVVWTFSKLRSYHYWQGLEICNCSKVSFSAGETSKNRILTNYTREAKPASSGVCTALSLPAMLWAAGFCSATMVLSAGPP